MREFKIYLEILKTYSFYFIILPLLGFIAGISIYFFQEKYYLAEALYEVFYTSENVEQKKIETDEVVDIMRQADFINIARLRDVQGLEVYKPAPIALHVRLLTRSQLNSAENLKIIDNFIFSRSAAQRLSSNVNAYFKFNWIVTSITGIGAGVLCAYFIALVQIFRRNY